MAFALSIFPLLASHLGLSGIKNNSIKKRRAGITSEPNIMRQPISKFH